MKIKYVVGDKEFDNKKEASKYEQSLLRINSDYSTGETVYFVNKSGLLVEAKIRNIEVRFNTIYYYFENYSEGKAENKVFRTPEIYFDYLLANIVKVS